MLVRVPKEHPPAKVGGDLLPDSRPLDAALATYVQKAKPAAAEQLYFGGRFRPLPGAMVDGASTIKGLVRAHDHDRRPVLLRAVLERFPFLADPLKDLPPPIRLPGATRPMRDQFSVNRLPAFRQKLVARDDLAFPPAAGIAAATPAIRACYEHAA